MTGARRWLCVVTLAGLGWVLSCAAGAPGLQAADAGVLPDASGPSEAARLMNDLMVGKVPIGGPFSLTDPSGARRTLRDFRGKIVLLYFGYTFCPDICPTDLSAIAAAIRSLGAAGEQVQSIFITVDPERDTPAVLRSYAAALDPRLIALRGSASETRTIATAYKAYYERIEVPGGRPYQVNHTAFIYLLDRDGKYIAFFPPGTPPDRIAATVRELMDLQPHAESVPGK